VSVYEDHASEDRTDWSRGGCRRVSFLKDRQSGIRLFGGHRQTAPNDFAIFETHNPWGYTVVKDAITANGHTYNEFTPSQLNGFTFSDYRVVILNWDDELTLNFLDDYKAAIPALEAYVSAGGVVWVQTAVQPSPDSIPFPLGGTCTFDLSVSDTIVDPTNPMVLGVPSPITGSYASQELESDLPGAARLVVAKTTASPHTGSFMALAGNISGHEPNGDSSFYQEFRVPAGGGILNLWHWDYTIDTTEADYEDAYITDANGIILQTVFHRTENVQNWLNEQVNLAPYAGQAIRVKFLVHQEGFVDSTAMYVDDVGLFAPCGSPTATPTATPTPRPRPTPRARPTPAHRPTPPR
jgi:hypothetical protein